MNIVKISNDELKLFSHYIKDISGIVLDNTKHYLLETRLHKLITETGSSSFLELYGHISSDKTDLYRNKILNAITTRETSFFRDNTPFEMLKYKIIPNILDKKNKGKTDTPVDIRIWSSACSSGQEIYSIAIMLKELLGDLSRHRLTLIGTDITDDAITQASYGFFNSLEAERGLSPEKLNTYFIRKDQGWKINDEIRSMVSFQKSNLMEDFSHLGYFDIVLCRNVAIYFSENDKKNLFDRIALQLKNDSYLVLGSSETLLGICPQYDSFRYNNSIYYQVRQ